MEPPLNHPWFFLDVPWHKPSGYLNIAMEKPLLMEVFMDINHPVWGSPMAMETSWNLHMKKRTSNWSNVSLLNPPLTCDVSGLPSLNGGTPVVTLFQYKVMVQCWMIWGIPGNLHLILFGMLWPVIKVAPRHLEHLRTNSCPLLVVRTTQLQPNFCISVRMNAPKPQRWD